MSKKTTTTSDSLISYSNQIVFLCSTSPSYDHGQPTTMQSPDALCLPPYNTCQTHTTCTMYLHTKIYSTHEFTSRVIIIVGSFGRMIQLNGRVFRHLENVTNFRVWGVALGSLLQLMNLLHLQVFHGSHMAHQGRLARAGKLAECAVVRSFFFFNGGLHFLQVSK